MIGRPAAWLAVPLAAAAGLACATTSQFEADLEAGRYQDAVSEFARDSSLHEDPEVSLQVAELYAGPSSPVYDRDRAIAMLEEWIARYPDHRDRYRAELDLNLLEETRRLERLLARQDSLTLQLADDLASVGIVRDTLEGRIVSANMDNIALSDSLDMQEQQIGELTEELRRVRRELEALKKIDVDAAHNGGS